MTTSEIKRYITAGNACFTLESTKVNLRYTYEVKQDKANKDRYLCKVLFGADNCTAYRFIGWFYKDKMSLQSNSKLVPGSPNHRFKMLHEFLFILNTMKELPEKCKFYPSGRCARCGRKLTTPDSVKRGFGPGCYEALGGE